MLPPRPWKISRAATLIREGGVVAYPTEAVFGLGCDPRNPEAVARLLAIKGRPARQGLILIAASFAPLRPFVKPLPGRQMKRVLRDWPGPHTWIFPAAPGVPGWLTGGHATLAVRVTDHPIAAALCRAAKTAIVSTSANRSGRPPLRDATSVRRRLGRHLDAIITGATGGLKRPTPIRDAQSGATLRK